MYVIFAVTWTRL